MGQETNALAWHAKPFVTCLCFPLQPRHSAPCAPYLHSGHLPLLAMAQILFFLDSGSLHMQFPLPKKSFLLVPILQLITICLRDSSVTSSQKPPRAPTSTEFSGHSLAAHLPTGRAVCGFKGEAHSEPATLPPLPPRASYVPGTWGPGNPCRNDPSPLLGLDEAW